MSDKSLAEHTLTQLRHILDEIFNDGQHWIKGLGTSDWRRRRYVSQRGRRLGPNEPSVQHVIESTPALFGHIEKPPTNQTAQIHHYLIVRADEGCLNEKGIALIRPVLKENFEGVPTLNFHVWFHCQPGANENDHLITGWRLEGPEGNSTSHNYFHAQPLKAFGPEERIFGLHDRFSVRFPTIPLPAGNTVELCLAAILIAGGREPIRRLIRNKGDSEVRKAARIFWERISADAATAQ